MSSYPNIGLLFPFLFRTSYFEAYCTQLVKTDQLEDVCHFVTHLFKNAEKQVGTQACIIYHEIAKKIIKLLVTKSTSTTEEISSVNSHILNLIFPANFSLILSGLLVSAVLEELPSRSRQAADLVTIAVNDLIEKRPTEWKGCIVAILKQAILVNEKHKNAELQLAIESCKAKFSKALIV